MIDLYPLSLIIGFVIGVAFTVVHYKVGWKNVFDKGDDENGKTNGTISRTKSR